MSRTISVAADINSRIKWGIAANLSATLESDCKRFRITNSGRKGGDQYCLWEKIEHAFRSDYTGEMHSCYNSMRSMGTSAHVKKRAETLRNEQVREEG